MGLLAGVDIGAYLHSVFGGDPAKLRRFTEGGANADPNAGNVRTPTEYDCDAYAEAVADSRIKESLIREGMVTIGVYAESLAVRPLANDEIDWDGQTFKVYHVDGDSVQAVWVLYATSVGE